MTAVVIHITGFREDCSRAISGIVANRKRIQEVHFIYPGYVSDEASMHPNWPKERERLEKAEIRILFEARLEPENFKDAQTIVEVPPYCELKLGGFEAIARTREAAAAAHHTFGISTVTALKGYSFWYGFLLVLCLLDWVWCRIWDRNKLFNSSDVRGRFLLRKGDRIVIPPEKSFGWRFWNPDVYPKEYGGEGAVLNPPLGAYAHLLWRLHTHSHLKFLGLWWMPLLCLWAFTALPWIWSFAWALSSITSFTAYTLVWVTEVILALIITSSYIQVPANWVYILLFPLYLGLFPFVVVYARNYVPQRSWD